MNDPIAWMVVNNDGREAFVTADPMLANVNIGQRALPLYTAPVMDTCAEVRSSSPTSGGGFVERELAVARGLADALDARVVPRWVHSTGQTPKQSGYKKDAECEQAAACLPPPA